MSPLVSICLPSLNAREFLEPRMESILAQTLADWELFVCDSHSDDGTWEYLQSFKDDPRVRLYKVPREGLYAGWNECLKRCRGEYVYIAPADDTCEPEFLERMVDALERVKTEDGGRRSEDGGRKSEVGGLRAEDGWRRTEDGSLISDLRSPDLCVCQFEFIDEQGNVVESQIPRLDRVYGDALHSTFARPRETELLIHYGAKGIPWVTASALVFRRSLLDKVGYFRTDIGANADVIWSMKCSFFSDTLSIPYVGATWRRYPSQGSISQSSADWPKIHYQCAAALLQELEHLVPDDWKRRKNWQKVLLEPLHYQAMAPYGLNRRVLKADPIRFMRSLGKAISAQPTYALERLWRGFDWNPKEFGSHEDLFRRLVECFE